ncbi:CGNR zinc finger domain-containing protein [Glaciibacter sp. 2TAF33]|uniref:CGNR zinc finger domain-containing protein n=1 Tax=Glaciibacter sp. 2TAF33 TaxID=3233015 RepID=UPI003F8F553C
MSDGRNRPKVVQNDPVPGASGAETDSPGPDAPGLSDEDLLVDFLNTVDVEDGTDLLGTEAGLAEWAAAYGLEPGDATATRSIRTALRSLVTGGRPELPSVTLHPSCDGDGVSLTSDTVAEAALAATVVLSIQGRIKRVKLCNAETCQYAYYDRSRNGSRAWCSMEICGNRQKARSFRAKQA